MMVGSPDSPGAPADGKKGAKRVPLRSSIACQRCRKSKIKCNNSGGDAPCETCIRNGKECTYPEVTPTPPKRPEPPATLKQEIASERKRLRRIDDCVKAESTVPAAIVAEDVLAAPFLTETIWSQVLDIYRLHFATELPFLPIATLKEKLSSKYRSKPGSETTSPELNLVLLGILTLTARFHQTLVSYITAPRNGAAGVNVNAPKLRGMASPDALAASEYYADVLTKALGGLRTSMATGSVERIQAFLMLGLYEWSQARPNSGGMAAWMYVGTAIRMAQALGLCQGDRDTNQGVRPRPVRAGPLQPRLPQEQVLIAKEIRRRTMFSCLILDRLLGCGKGRVSAIRSEDLQIQLPCSEIAFDLSEEVYTGFLKPTEEEAARPIPHDGDSTLGRFVRLVDLWGEISKWSFAGGRFTERYAPWQPESTFYQLRAKLDAFYDELPARFRWSKATYYGHENQQASSVYVSLHMLGAVCRIMLHREYVPFIPIHCERPIGPLDEPTFPAGDEPPQFWDDGAEQLFRAAREIVDLIEICRDKLPMSPLVLFAVWTAAFVGIYAASFPHMDPQRHMLPEDAKGGDLDVTIRGPTATTYKALTTMSVWLRMAETYVSYYHQMVRYYNRVKVDYERHTGKKPSAGPLGDSRFSLRMGGGGLEEWKQHGAKIVNHGEILAVDDEQHGSSRDSTIEPGSSTGPDSSHTDHTKTPRSTSMSFTPINNNGHHPSMSGDGGSDAAQDRWGVHPSQGHSQQPQQSPSQSSYALPSPQAQHAQQQMPYGAQGNGILPSYAGQDVSVYVEQHQSMPWLMVPGGIHHFAHGGEDWMADGGNGFWGGAAVGDVSGVYM